MEVADEHVYRVTGGRRVGHVWPLVSHLHRPAIAQNISLASGRVAQSHVLLVGEENDCPFFFFLASLPSLISFRVGSFAAGGFLPLVEFLQNIGITSMAEWMATEGSEWHITGPMGSTTSLQALDIAFTVTISRSLWIFSIVNLLIAGGLTSEYVLEMANNRAHGLRGHSIFALSIACVAFFAWVFELAAFWSPYEVLFTAGVMNLVFVGSLCAWCVWLAIWIFPKFDLEAESTQTMEYI